MKFILSVAWHGFVGYCVGSVIGEAVGTIAEKAILKYYGIKGE